MGLEGLSRRSFGGRPISVDGAGGGGDSTGGESPLGFI